MENEETKFKIKYVLYGPEIEKIVHETKCKCNNKVVYESCIYNYLPKYVLSLITNSKDFKDNDAKLEQHVKDFTKTLHNVATVYKYRFHD